MSRAVGIMVAPNGARLTTQDHPVLPVTIEKTVEAVVQSVDVGAGAVHLHVRDDDGQHLLDAGRYKVAMAALRDRLGADFPIQVTTESVGKYSAEQQIELVRELKPDFISAALAEIIPDASHQDLASDFYRWTSDQGVAVQHILYSPKDLERFIDLQDSGIISDEHRSLLFVLGRYTEGQVSNTEDLDAFLGELERRGVAGRYRWMICAFGENETECLVYAAARGGHVRVGFENNRLHPDGRIAINNAERVEDVCQSLRKAGHGIAIESEIYEVLGRAEAVTDYSFA